MTSDYGNRYLEEGSKQDVEDTGSGTVEETEPVATVTETLGWDTPEELNMEDMTGEEEAPDLSSMSAYDRYRITGSSDDLYAVTQELKPTIGSVLSSFGGAGNPQLESRARVLAAKAVKTYDPSRGASLPTWVSNQLRQMVRDVRKANSPIHVPDGVKLDAYSIYRAEEEFKDEHGREPTMDELADKCRLSIRRIQNVRRKMRPVSSGSAEDASTGEVTDVSVNTFETDYSKDALDYVYSDCDRIDKKILEYTTGYNGFEPKGTKEIMKELNLTPVQLTRRKARLSYRMRDIIADLEGLQNG